MVKQTIKCIKVNIKINKSKRYREAISNETTEASQETGDLKIFLILESKLHPRSGNVHKSMSRNFQYI